MTARIHNLEASIFNVESEIFDAKVALLDLQESVPNVMSEDISIVNKDVLDNLNALSQYIQNKARTKNDIYAQSALLPEHNLFQVA